MGYAHASYTNDMSAGRQAPWYAVIFISLATPSSTGALKPE
jgi:hypothetical protein